MILQWLAFSLQIIETTRASMFSDNIIDDITKFLAHEWVCLNLTKSYF